MTIFNLDSDPNLYVLSSHWEAKDANTVVVIDYTKGQNIKTVATLSHESQDDVLVVYGTEIKGNLLKRLHRSLLLPDPVGLIRVNCQGVCYFRLKQGASNWQTPLDDEVFRFDWSVFGVTVPNSAIGSITKRLIQQENKNQELKCQNSELKSQLTRMEIIASEIEPVKAKIEATEKTLDEYSKQLQNVNKLDEREVKLNKLKIELSQLITKFTQESINSIMTV